MPANKEQLTQQELENIRFYLRFLCRRNQLLCKDTASPFETGRCIGRLEAYEHIADVLSEYTVNS